MENQYRKWVTFSYVAVGALLWFLFSRFGHYVAASFDLEARVRNIDIILQISSIVVGTLAFVILYSNQKANQFMGEVVVELSRVTWPTQKETTNATIVSIIMVLISGMVLGLLDYIWTKLIQAVL